MLLFPGVVADGDVRLASLVLYRTHEWFGQPTVYFHCLGEQKVYLPDVIQKDFVYDFIGQESWQVWQQQIDFYLWFSTQSYYFWGLAHFFACLLAGLLTSSLARFLTSFTCLLWGSRSSSGNEGDFYVDNAVTLLPGFWIAATDISGRCKVQAMWVLWRGQAEVWWQIWWVGALPHWIHSWTWWQIYPFQQRWVQCHICVSWLQ